MTDEPTEPAARAAHVPTTCPRCGATIAADQAWCTECGLAARTRLAPSPNWRTPLVAAAAIGLAAILALVVAFVVLTGDNAPVPVTTSTTAPAAAPAAPATTTTAPVTPPTTTAAPTTPTTTIPPATVPTTTTPPTGTSTAPTGAE